MAGKLTLEVAVPERLLVEEEVDEVQIPAADGYLGVLPDHAPLMAQLGFGVMSFRVDDQTKYVALHGGLVEVLPDHVRVLADGAEWADEVDSNLAEQARQRAVGRFDRQETDMQVDVERAQAAIARAQARLDASKRAG
jgi:F-type H+-transporting ATPase subunit epsilon